ncbi:MAG TPA: 2Fe-2S iron-sulfur cluster-binding protein [Candidatus Acidoferrales bacterium]|nr:2Fe-2S iron-sulfur cluster-binding protein [Candidatus Acidoferrales bacterium]
MPKVTFMPSGQSFEVAEGTTILVSAIQNGLSLQHDCTEAICGTDRVRILEGTEHLSQKTENEELTLEMMNAGPDERLGCVTRVLGDVTVKLPD